MCRTTPKKEGKIGDYSPNKGKFWPVAEYLSLKQGLKPIEHSFSGWILFVADYIPLKQGLKLMSPEVKQIKSISCRVPSTKTRIETVRFVQVT